MDKRKKHFAKLEAEEIRRKPPTKAQKRNQMYSFVPMDSEVVEGKDDAEKAELKLCLEIVPRDDKAINVESLATKYPIIFIAMLDDFDRQDVLDLYRLRLYDSCGIHILLMDTGITIHIMIEKKDPLTPEMLSRMLSGKLEVDRECEMAYELLRFTKSQLKK
ncbi:hypothetical protein Tco_0972570 [Tanacetum coccineum]